MSVFFWTVNIVGVTIVTGSIVFAFIVLPFIMKRAEIQSYIAMARAVETREPHLLGHAERAAKYLRFMGLLAGCFAPRQLRDLEVAAITHTVGKVGVPCALLQSPTAPATAADRFGTQEYVRIGASIIEAVPPLSTSADTVRYHREYMDGSGYPYGRYGKSIPFSSRMLCVVTEFVAMTSPRVYRPDEKAMTPEAAIAVLEAGVHSKYDPHAVGLLKKAHQMRCSLLGAVMPNRD